MKKTVICKRPDCENVVKHKRTYCSNECYQWHIETTRSEPVYRECLHCQKPLELKDSWDRLHKKFCNTSCSASFNNRGVRRHGEEPEKNCWWCGEELKRNLAIRGKFCNNSCHKLYEFWMFIHYWKIGLVDGRIGTASERDRTSRRIKRYLIFTRGEKCEICGWDERHPKTGNVPITLEHRDGDPTNNREDNLQLLCPNHHSLTLTYCALNKGNGRKSRYKKALI